MNLPRITSRLSFTSFGRFETKNKIKKLTKQHAVNGWNNVGHQDSVLTTLFDDFIESGDHTFFITSEQFSLAVKSSGAETFKNLHGALLQATAMFIGEITSMGFSDKVSEGRLFSVKSKGKTKEGVSKTGRSEEASVHLKREMKFIKKIGFCFKQRFIFLIYPWKIKY